jgi:hypothetical protein
MRAAATNIFCIFSVLGVLRLLAGAGFDIPGEGPDWESVWLSHLFGIARGLQDQVGDLLWMRDE